MIYLGQNPIGVSNYCMPGDYDQMKQDVDDLKESAVTDVQVNGASVVANGIANVPIANNTGNLGVVKGSETYGTKMHGSNGSVMIAKATSEEVKSGIGNYKPIVPITQHEATFYGLAKAAGVDMASSSNAVGTYTSEAKNAIQSMLGVEPGICFVEIVSGTTPSITGEANVRYICGTVSTISITPPSIGTIDVKFTSGSTPAILTLPSTVKFPEWVDMTTLEADTVYEIMITDGVYGGVMTWQG